MNKNNIISTLEALIERKEKKKKEKLEDPKVRVDGHMSHPALDLSDPLGSLSTYKMQGMSNFGPYTADTDGLRSGDTKELDMSVYGSKFKESAWDIALSIVGKKIVK